MRAFSMPAALILANVTMPCSAQEAPPPETLAGDGTTIFSPDFFAASRPRTALDMVRLIPGFSIETDVMSARGLGDVTGNVLIDGVRPPKSSPLNAELERIPASIVATVELYRAAQSGVDMAGYPLVVNIVRKPAGTSRASTTIGVGVGMRGGTNASLSGEGSTGGARARKSASINYRRESWKAVGTHELDQTAAGLLSEAVDSATSDDTLNLASSVEIPVGKAFDLTVSGTHLRQQGNVVAPVRRSGRSPSHAQSVHIEAVIDPWDHGGALRPAPIPAFRGNGQPFKCLDRLRFEVRHRLEIQKQLAHA